VSSLWALVGSAIPNDHARQVSAYDLARREMARADAPATVLDLGCGDAASARVFRGVKPDVRWLGLDVAGSRLARAVRDEVVVLYDGEHIPLATGSIPLVYSRQVLEHVRHPEPVLAEVARILIPGGVFIGSTSHLEPYHAYSLWNYTPYGFKVLVEAVGLELDEIRPGLDGRALITRLYEGNLPEHGRWFGEESPLNVEIDEWGLATGRRPALINHRKLEFCGHFCFRVRKPPDWRPAQEPGLAWSTVRSDGRRVAEEAVVLGAHTLRRAARSPRVRAVVRAVVIQIPGARGVVRALRKRGRARAGR
jgi:SAM-dependent methyltransferase